MSSKSDFLSWDDSDLNLDLLLGDFTASDIESEDDYVPPAKTAKPQKEATTASANNSERQALYQCSDCDKTYSSVSGFRGHLRTKHSLSSIKVLEELSENLTNRIAELATSEQKNRFTTLESLLEKCFPVIRVKNLRPVVMSILKHLPKIDDKYLTKILEDKELYSEAAEKLRGKFGRKIKHFLEMKSPLYFHNI
ncbi:COBRA1 [Mytilus edulis]|uniref:COBRA1 n=1 Tax=Mytilus edulis TaxID=6550 RepID=A0A8S3RKF3_MYTED|nr:COBRA1 [Mytilus edulis]